MNKRAEVSQDTRSNGVEKEEQERQSPSQHLIFSNPAQRQEHIQAFLKWLPNILHDAPGICWDELPSRVMGYLIRNVPPDDPDAWNWPRKMETVKMDASASFHYLNLLYLLPVQN